MIDLEDYKKANLHTYQRFVGYLMYFSCGKRPDIIFVVGQLSRYNANLKKGHFQAAKKIVKYLKKIIKMNKIFG